MLNITEPIKTVQGLLTYAIAAETPLLYLMQREDYDIFQITDNGGEARMSYLSGNLIIRAPGFIHRQLGRP